jgi:hypothetical protein
MFLGEGDMKYVIKVDNGTANKDNALLLKTWDEKIQKISHMTSDRSVTIAS